MSTTIDMVYSEGCKCWQPRTAVSGDVRGYGSFGDSSAAQVIGRTAEMNTTLAQLRAGIQQLADKQRTTLSASTSVSQAIYARLGSLTGIVNTLDYTTRLYVITPGGGPFGTQDAAWAAWQSGAQDVSNGISEVAQTLGEWSLVSVVEDIGDKAGDYFKGVGTVAAVGVAGLAALYFLGGRSRGLAGYKPRKKRKSRR